jgi:hypothetical protein
MPPPRSKPRVEKLMETIGPPVSSRPWSPQFVAQTLEVLPVGLGRDGLYWMKPVHADSLRVGLPPSSRPAEVVLDVLKSYPLAAIVVHSTSWRHEEARIILTYVAAIESPGDLASDSLVAVPVRRAELARGGARSAPEEIAIDAVLEHALRHLSWLARDDPAVSSALESWKPVLAGFEPEPFRALA